MDEGRAALIAHPLSRVHDSLVVLPKLVSALDRVCIYRTEMRGVREALTVAVREFRMATWQAQRQHPEITYKAAEVQAALRKVTELLDKLDRLLHNTGG